MTVRNDVAICHLIKLIIELIANWHHSVDPWQVALQTLLSSA